MGRWVGRYCKSSKYLETRSLIQGLLFDFAGKGGGMRNGQVFERLGEWVVRFGSVLIFIWRVVSVCIYLLDCTVCTCVMNLVLFFVFFFRTSSSPGQRILCLVGREGGGNS